MITSTQNQDLQLNRLAAQRQLYQVSKRVLTANMVLSGPVAAATTIIAFLLPAVKGYTALWGIIAVLLSNFWLSPWQKRRQQEAAGVQEAFDCDVLDLPWSELKVGKRQDPELVKEYSDLYKRRSHRMPPLPGWYPAVISKVPDYIGRLICQRSNCRWDQDLRRRYRAWLIGFFLAIFVFSLALGFRWMTLEDWTLKIIAPLSSTFVFGMKQIQDLNDSSVRLKSLKEYAEALWAKALSGHPEAEIASGSRALQDEIFENRKRSPLVFDWVYRRLQGKHEDHMNHTAEELIQEALVKGFKR
ncbi:MAG: hypothetical protein HYZ13_03840 [Acidobacteria bacterium]|nr:hypothetical protein [Acidobacteriota bacterium]